MPSEEDGHNWAHKFPFVASEVFSSEADVIFNFFFLEPKPPMQVKLKKALDSSDDKKDQEDVVFEDELPSDDDEQLS